MRSELVGWNVPFAGQAASRDDAEIGIEFDYSKPSTKYLRTHVQPSRPAVHYRLWTTAWDFKGINRS